MIRGLYEAHLPVSDLSRSVEFYQNIGLEMAHKSKGLAFFWIEKGKSWLGLWESEHVNAPNHPSLRHIAFRVDYQDMKKAKLWLKERGIDVHEAFGFQPISPIVLVNPPQSHAVIYFRDPDENQLEFICPLEIDTCSHTQNMYLDDWENRQSQ